VSCLLSTELTSKGPLAQWLRASDLHSEGREFDSLRVQILAMPYSFENQNRIVVQDKRRRSVVAEFEVKRKLLRSIVRDTRFSSAVRQAAQIKLANLPKNVNPVRTSNRCTVTGRGRGVSRRLKMSRIAARSWIHNGKLPGVGKASW
jgi:small subunit ribosomal protein S14